MPHLPELRVVLLERIRPHEEIDPLRVDRLAGRMEAEGTQVNPMVCSEAPNGELVLLDGATRAESLGRIGLEHAVVQIVDPAEIALDTWHHVVMGVAAEVLLAAMSDHPSLRLKTADGTPRVHPRRGDAQVVVSVGLSPNATLGAVVHTYVGRWTVRRVTDPSIESVRRGFPDWSALIEFPKLTVADVMKAAVGNDLLPAGITRFLVPERALRLNISLDLLRAGISAEDKQAALDDLLTTRAAEGRVRRYDEPVVVLDE